MYDVTIAASLGLSSHFYADDSQLYMWGPPSTIPHQRRRMELGVERIAEWMHSNRLRLNPEKTDFLWCAIRRRCIHLDTSELSVCGALTSVRDLGVLLESDLSMRRHVAWTVGCCFASSVSSGAASSRCLLGLRRRLSPLLSLRAWIATTACSPARLLDGL